MVGKRWRYLDLYVHSYADATMCINPAIARAKGEGLVPDTIAVYSHRKNSVIVGRQNDPEVDIDLSFCRERKIIAKRVPTPGTVFGHSGYIIAGFYMPRNLLPESIGEAFSLVLSAFCRELEKKWGVTARYRPLNDVEVMIGGSWRKISPCSLTFFGESACFRIGLTIKSPPMDLVEGALPPPPGKLSDKQARNLSERIGCLEEAAEREISISEAKDIYVTLAEKMFDARVEAGGISDVEMKYDRELIEKYDNDEWFYANTVSRRFRDIPSGSILKESSIKVPSGPLIRARTLLKGGRIVDVSITGWFHGISPLEATELIEKSLRDVPASEDQIRSRVRTAFDAHGIRVGNSGPEDISGAILRAVQEGRVLREA